MRKLEFSNKMIITNNLLNKINYLCNQFPSNEWSGTLFYTIEGDISTENCKIIASDLYLQDIGSGAFTEFENDETRFDYMRENNLFELKRGLVHSHNQMGTTFSGTDESTLREFGETHTHFLSLIVNNKGDYNARLSVKMISESIQSYDKVINLKKEDLNYINLNIIYEVDQALVDRIKILNVPKTQTNKTSFSHTVTTRDDYNGYYNEPNLFRQPVTKLNKVTDIIEMSNKKDISITPFVFLYRLWSHDFKTHQLLIEADSKLYKNKLKTIDENFKTIDNDDTLDSLYDFMFDQLHETYCSDILPEEETNLFSECYEILCKFHKEKGCSRTYKLVENLIYNNIEIDEDDKDPKQ